MTRGSKSEAVGKPFVVGCFFGRICTNNIRDILVYKPDDILI